MTAVNFGSNPGTQLAHNSDGTITVTSPAGSGTVDVTAVSPGGTSTTSLSDEFTYGVGPSVAGLDYHIGPANQPVLLNQEIIGKNLIGATDVLYGAVDIPISPSEIRDYGLGYDAIGFFSPPTEGPGTVDVRVITPDGESPTTSIDRFTYTAAPIILTQDVSQGPLAGGTTVNLYGDNLSTATGVKFGGAPAIFSFNADGSIAAVSPSSSAGTVQITVTGPGGTSAQNVPFAYVGVPNLSSISPASGPVAGGNRIAIAGTGLLYVSEVDFGDVATSDCYALSDGILFVTVPAGALGTVDVKLVSIGGSSTISAADHYTYDPLPTITGLSRSTGALEGGTTVTITGTGLANAGEVDFGDDFGTDLPNPATIISKSDTQIMVVSPSSDAGDTNTVDVTVTTPDGTTALNSADQFTYNHTPLITTLEVFNQYDVQVASGGLAAGGTTVYIEGDDLIGVTGVDFGNTPAANFTDYGNGVISAVSPAGTQGTVDITVTTPIGTSDPTPADQFTYAEIPAITSISPSSGVLAGGTLVEINGIGLANASEVDFGEYLDLGYGNAGTIVSDTDTQILVMSPLGGNGPDTVDVTVTTPIGGTSATTAADQFSYVSPPTIDQSDYAGAVAGNTLVTITGSFLAGATEVDFGANAGTIISNTDGQIVALTPEATGDAPGPVTLSVTNPYGTSTGQFTYVLPPTVTGIDQTTGPAAGGTSVIISGSNLSGATAVNFGGVPAESFSDNGDGTFTAVSPAGAVSTVDVTVTTPGGTTGTSPADEFTYLPAPS